jgi:hypothetical protein
LWYPFLRKTKLGAGISEDRREESNMTRPIGFALCGLLLCLVACVSTRLVCAWKAPDVQSIHPVGKKVAAVYISSDEGSRRAAEDVLVQKLNQYGARGVAAYTLIPSAELRDMDRVRARLTEAGVEGVVVMRVISVKQRVSYTPGYYASGYPGFPPYYMRFSGYWGYGWVAVYDCSGQARARPRILQRSGLS